MIINVFKGHHDDHGHHIQADLRVGHDHDHDGDLNSCEGFHDHNQADY